MGGPELDSGLRDQIVGEEKGKQPYAQTPLYI